MHMGEGVSQHATGQGVCRRGGVDRGRGQGGVDRGCGQGVWIGGVWTRGCTPPKMVIDAVGTHPTGMHSF